jgi:RNA polymerase sigma-70 factor (ECF subfamily)
MIGWEVVIVLKDGERPLKAEEQEFLRGLYQNHYQALFDYAYQLGIGREAAEDYVQDAFMTVIRHIEDIRKTRSPRMYLNQALKNVIGYRMRSIRYAVNLQKKLREQPDLFREGQHTDELPPETLFHGAIGEAELTLLIRFYLEGWSQKELAEEMGVSENACKQRIKRAKAHLRNALEGDKPPGADGPTDAGSGLTGRRPGQK